MTNVLSYNVKMFCQTGAYTATEVFNIGAKTGSGWRIPTRAELFSMLDSEQGNTLREMFGEKCSFFVKCGNEISLMQFTSNDNNPTYEQGTFATIAFLIKDDMYVHLTRDIRSYEKYACDRIISILYEFGCTDKYLNLDAYRGSREECKPFVDMPDGIIQDNDMDCNTFVGVRLIEPTDDPETDYIIEFDTANGRMYHLYEFNVIQIYSLLFAIEGIYKLVKGNFIGIETYPLPK